MPKRPLSDANFFSLFIPFSRAQELSNEPHIVLYSFLARPRGVGVLFEWEGLNVCARIKARGPNFALKLEENRAPPLYKDFIGIALAGSSRN